MATPLRQGSDREANDFSGKKILVVDDNVFLGRMISKALSKYLNIGVFKAENSGQAIAAALTGGYHGAIIDLALNGASSMRIVRTIKTMLPEFPIAVMYDHPADDMMAGLRRCGVTCFLHKPFKITTLIEEITQMLGGEGKTPAPNRPITVED
jgi:DNA-binding NtrC family response regulator